MVSSADSPGIPVVKENPEPRAFKIKLMFSRKKLLYLKTSRIPVFEMIESNKNAFLRPENFSIAIPQK